MTPIVFFLIWLSGYVVSYLLLRFIAIKIQKETWTFGFRYMGLKWSILSWLFVLSQLIAIVVILVENNIKDQDLPAKW